MASTVLAIAGRAAGTWLRALLYVIAPKPRARVIVLPNGTPRSARRGTRREAVIVVGKRGA
jgi:hypothetical protein